MATNFDVIVIGAGAMGSAAGYHLARRGARVLVLEQFDIPHDRGSSHGLSRMIRSAYYEHPDYVPLIRQSFELWRELENESREKLLHVTGGLYIGSSSSEFVLRSLESARKHKLDHEMLDHKAIAERYPQFRLPDDHIALFETDAGLLIPERCITAFATLAMIRGAQIRTREPVLSWSASEKDVVVKTSANEYHAQKLIFTAGAWTAKLLSDLGVKLQVTRQAVGWVRPVQPELFALGKFPVWAIDPGDATIYYGFPLLPDFAGLKIAHHIRGLAVDPATVDRTPQPDDEATFRPALTRHLPDADGPLLSMRICLYTYSPDEHFIIGHHPQHKNVILAGGFSGHGFKFAPVVGEILADLAMNDTTSLPAKFLSLRRFT